MKSLLIIATVVLLVQCANARHRQLSEIKHLGKQGFKNFTSNLVNLPSLPVFREQIRSEDCINTPEEYQQAFMARQPRCVSKDLVARISQGNFPFDVANKPSFFFSGSDGLEKYLRFGFPETLGLFTPSNVFNRNYSTAAYQGLQEISNGQAFLEAVGYSATDINSTEVYTLWVLSRKAIKHLIRSPLTNNFTEFQADVGGVRPTWRAVAVFFEQAFKKQGLEISEEAVEILEEKSFDELTSCPGICSFANLAFPSNTATNAVVAGNRTSLTECFPPGPESGYANYVQIPPTSFDARSPFCSDLWKEKFTKYKTAYSANPCFSLPYPQIDQNLATVARMLVEDLATAPDALTEAIIFRAYLIQSCSGSYNALFTGDGFTATGLSGLAAPLASEWIFSPFYISEIPEKGKASIPFCINGQGGMRNSAGNCALP